MAATSKLTPEQMSNHWMPFSANRDFKQDPKMFGKAEGVYYYDRDGRKILDGSSGLFTTPAGHSRREIAEAVYKQLSELDFTPSFLRSHDKSFELAAKIAKLMPEDYALGNLPVYVEALAASKPMYSPDGRFVPGAVETAYQVLKVFDPAVAGATIDLKKTYNETFVQKALTN